MMAEAMTGTRNRMVYGEFAPPVRCTRIVVTSRSMKSTPMKKGLAGRRRYLSTRAVTRNNFV